MPSVIPLRTAKVSFCNGIPGSPIFPVPPKLRHLTAFVGMPTKFVRKIHEPSRARVLQKFVIAQKVPVFWANYFDGV